jgi:hypothetical protein
MSVDSPDIPKKNLKIPPRYSANTSQKDHNIYHWLRSMRFLEDFIAFIWL